MTASTTSKPELSLADVDRFLRDHYAAVTHITLLKGGAWSTAFGFNSGGEPLVVRFGQHGEDYAKDRMAANWSLPLLPTPPVFEVGEAFDGAFAVSQRLHGDKLDGLPAQRLTIAVDALMQSLVVLRTVELPGRGYGIWLAPDGTAPHRSWRDFLVAVPHRDDVRLRGWRERLAAVPDAQRVFDRGQLLLEQLAHHCADERGVIHSDLLYGNVLVSQDNRISAIFDWGNSLAGDSLYDVAWLMFWAPWHPGIDVDRVRRSAWTHFGGAEFDERLTCYQLHIALAGMQYQAFAGLSDDLDATARRTTLLLHR